MRTMILDTSTNLLYISFVEDEKVIYEVKTLGLNNHSDHLLPLIEEGLKQNNLQVKDFDKVILGVGPGAYTGLRVSMSVAKMFCWTLNIPLYTISSLDLLTSGIKEDGKYEVGFKAKKGYIYHKIFEIKDHKFKCLTKETFESIDILDNNQYKILTHDEMSVDSLNLEGREITKVDNIHALEPNYLRDC